MKHATHTATPDNDVNHLSRVKRIIGKIRRHPDQSTNSSPTNSPSSSSRSSASSACSALPHISCHRSHGQQQRRRCSVADAENDAHDLEIWNAAYDALKRDPQSAGLVIAYETIISQELPDVLRPGHHGNPNGLPAEHERRVDLMTRIAESGLDRQISMGSKSDSEDNDAREILIETRRTVSDLMAQKTCAAVAWAGISSLTPLLLDPLLRHDDIRQGFIYLTSNIQHFMLLPRVLHVKSWNFPADHQRICPQVRQTLIDLYRRLLEYEMNIVCAAGSAWNMAARNVVDWKGWTAMIDAVREKDDDISKEMAKFGNGEVRSMIGVTDEPGGGSPRLDQVKEVKEQST